MGSAEPSHELSDAPEMSPEAKRLRQLIRFNEPAAPVAVPGLLVVWWFYPSPSILILAGLVASTVMIQRRAIRHTVENRVQQGITALSISIWVPTLGMAVVAPDVWALTLVFTVLSVLLALPFVDAGGVLCA